MTHHPFHYAAVEGKAALVKAMIEKNLVDANFQGLLCCSKWSSILQVLLSSGTNPNVMSIHRSPLHCAVEWSVLECVEPFIKTWKGFDKDYKLEHPWKLPMKKSYKRQ
jgi:ankyrin repeat protein